MKIYEGDILTCDAQDHVYRFLIEEAGRIVYVGNELPEKYEDVWDCIFAGIHFCFSGYFCAIGKSGISFLHNIIAIALMRIPGVYLTSKLFPNSLFPMGLATASGSIISVIICVIAFYILIRRESVRREVQHG